MKIAISKKELNKLGSKANDLIEALRKNNEIIIIDEENFSNDDIKKEFINVLITDDVKIIRNIFSSISINTSTYVISPKDSLLLSPNNHYLVDFSEPKNIVAIVNHISRNRKPSAEKIGNRNYTDEQLMEKFPEMRNNDYLMSQRINPNNIATDYFGVKTTYGDYWSDVIDWSKKLNALGIKEDDYVGLCLPNTSETFKLFSATKQRGAVCNNIFPLSTPEEMKFCLNLFKSKVAFVLDSRYKDLRSIIDQTYLDKVFLLTPFESLPILNKPYNLKQKVSGFRPKDSGYGFYEDFLNVEGQNYDEPKYYGERINSIQYTSGTTGTPKAVPISEDTFNVRDYQYKQINVGLEEGVRFLQCLPICGKAYGEFTMHLGLANGACNVIVPKFASKDLGKMIKKYNVQGLTMPPTAWLNFIDSPEFKTLDLSNFKMATVGGDGAIPKFINMIQDALERQGFKGIVILGSGGTELGVTFSTNTLNSNKPGTSGQLLVGNKCHIYKDGEECGYNEKGTVYYDCVGACTSYANEGVELVKNELGIDLGDYGYIDEQGFITVCGRRDDMIIIGDKKICPMEIEEMINECPYVKYGYVVKSCNPGKFIRICYTSYEYNSNVDARDEIMKCVPKELRCYTEIYHVSHIPETSGLKADRRLLSSDRISELIYSPAKTKKRLFKNVK